MAAKKKVSGKGGKISREDFEAFKFGVERLKSLEAELNLLDTKAFPYEATSIRRKLKDVSMIPVIEREIRELKLKIDGKSPAKKAARKRKVRERVEKKIVKSKKKVVKKVKSKSLEKVSKKKRVVKKKIKPKKRVVKVAKKVIKKKVRPKRKIKPKRGFSEIEKDFKKGFGKDVKRIIG
tara:strand:- start:14781 stop:15317 length:537 start_codon:yes stop_codon:yes gene_type:complete